MPKRDLAVIVAAVIVTLPIIWWARRPRENEIPYRGTMIKLSKSYSDFDTYKNDPDNIDPSETARVQKLVMEAPVAHSFSSRMEVFRATGEIQFPGYGGGSGGAQALDGSELLALTFEIPRANKDRYIVFRGHNGHFELIDDFVEVEIPGAFIIREENGAYIYLSDKGEIFRRNAAPGHLSGADK